MAIHWRKVSLFGIGLAFGVGAGVLGAVLYRDARVLDVHDSTRVMGAPPAVADPAAAAQAEGQCEAAPLIGSSGNGDGQIALQARPATGSGTEVSSLLLAGKEAAAAGRKRDAEVSFLNACRNAARLGAADPVPLADAEYQLARHYANVAAFGAPRARELFERAERLYSASYLTYAARLGPQHEKTRFAQEGLKTVQQVTGGYGPVAPPPVAHAPAPAAAPAPAPQAAAPAPAPQAVASAPAPQAAASAPPRAAASAPATVSAPTLPKEAREPTAPREVAKAPVPREPTRAVRPRTEPLPERPAPVEVAPAPAEAGPPPVVAEPRRRTEPRRAAPRPGPVDSADADVPPPPPPVRVRPVEPPPELTAPPGTASGSVSGAAGGADGGTQ